MPDPPASAGSPPPFTGNDIRIAPSGPYVPGGVGGLIHMGWDAVVRTIALPSNGLNFAPIPRSQGPAVPLRVVFPSWLKGDTLVIWWHVSGGILPSTPAPASMSLQIVPTVDVGAGVSFIDNAHVIWQAPASTVLEPQGVALAGIAAIQLANPAQPPTVQLFYSLNDGSGAGTELSVAGVGPAEAAGSIWLAAAELNAPQVFQFPPEVVLTPLI